MNDVPVEDTKPTLTIKDCMDLMQKVEGIKCIAGLIGNGSVVSRGKRNLWAPVDGASHTIFTIRNLSLERGRYYTDREDREGQRVIVLGAGVASALFDKNEDPIGKEIWINEFIYKVVGVLKRRGDGGWPVDRAAFLPLHTGMKRTFGDETLCELNILVTKKELIPQTIAQITIVLRRNHKLHPARSNDFSIASQDAVLEMAMEVQNTFRILLATIAAISLLVGGIGIMNIMLVTVTGVPLPSTSSTL